MPDTIHLKLPYLAPAQAQKHVTHNDALRRLDALVQLAVLDTALSAPPGSPAEGDRHVVAAGATGAWAGHDGEVASFADGAWEFAAPESGWIAYDAASGSLLVFADDEWQGLGGFLGTLDRLGINAAADATNRLAVRSEAVLFSGLEAGEGGTGDIRFVVNKEADGDTASLLFQSGFSGRAEIGLAGDTDFVFKVSPDGSAWTEAIRIDKDTGLATILYDNGTSGLAADTVQDALDELAAGSGGGGGGAVASVFGRTGAVVAAASDYDASQVDNDSSVSGAMVSDALNALKTSADGKLAIASNLSDLASAATARGNLGLGDAATKNTGTSAGTVAAGDDSRITGAAQKASNLSDLASAATAFANIKQAASDTATGVVELATTAEADAGTDTARAVTPAGLASATRGKQSVWVPAGAMVARISNGPSAGIVELATNKNVLPTLDFDPTSQEFAQFDIRMPKGWNEGTVSFVPVWSHPATATNFGVVWGLAAVAISDDDPLDAAFGTAQASADTGGTTNDLYQGPESAAITIAGSPAEGDYVQFRIHRDPSDGADTMAVDARLHGVLLLYVNNAAKDD